MEADRRQMLHHHACVLVLRSKGAIRRQGSGRGASEVTCEEPACRGLDEVRSGIHDLAEVGAEEYWPGRITRRPIEEGTRSGGRRLSRRGESITNEHYSDKEQYHTDDQGKTRAGRSTYEGSRGHVWRLGQWTGLCGTTRRQSVLCCGDPSSARSDSVRMVGSLVH